MTTEIIEAEAVEVSRAITVREPVDVASWTPSFVQTIDEAVAQVHARDDFMHKVMRKDLDYGVIPGTGTKPTLLKPGAERLLSAYGLHPQLVDKVPPTLDYLGKEHAGEPFFEFRKTCRVWRQTGPSELDRMLVAEAGGSCNSWETKYRYRNAARRCPNCGGEHIIKGKAEFGGGWLCWKKKGGCGDTFAATDARITDQADGKVANEAVADVVNTVEKMAEKRALVAATIIATGWSDLVTQDVEDNARSDVQSSAEASVAGGDGTFGAHDSPPIPEAAASEPAAPVRLPHEGEPCAECAKENFRNTRGNVPTFFVPKSGPNEGKVICNGRNRTLNAEGKQGWCAHYPPLVPSELAAGDVDPESIPF